MEVCEPGRSVPHDPLYFRNPESARPRRGQEPDVLSVPPTEPYVFVMLERDAAMVFLNDIKAAEEDYPPAVSMPQGGTAAMFFVITGVDAYHEQVAPKATVIIQE